MLFRSKKHKRKKKTQNLKTAPEQIEQADKPETSVVSDDNIRATISELGEALLGLKRQVEDEEKVWNNECHVVPEAMALEEPVVESGRNWWWWCG